MRVVVARPRGARCGGDEANETGWSEGIRLDKGEIVWNMLCPSLCAFFRGTLWPTGIAGIGVDLQYPVLHGV